MKIYPNKIKKKLLKNDVPFFKNVSAIPSHPLPPSHYTCDESIVCI